MSRPRVAAVALAAALALGIALALGGCSGGDDDERGASQPSSGGRPAAPPGPSRAGEPTEGRVIRAWSAALSAGDFTRAASFFAAGAVVEQGVEIRLRGRSDAIRFNMSLPCRSEVTDVDDDGETTIAAFRLLPGRGGACRGGGTARVRFRVREGKFREWRQLDGEDEPAGQIA